MDDEAEVTMQLVRALLGAASEVHRVLGPGLLEAVYADCLGLELGWRAIPFERQVAIPLVYKGSHLGARHRVDLLVDRRVPLRLLSVEPLLPLHQAQLRTVLRLARLPLGLLINFNVPVLQAGIRRVINHTGISSPAPSQTLCPELRGHGVPNWITLRDIRLARRSYRPQEVARILPRAAE
ncbi:MAG: GxxExxY protein [Gemmatimonadales bacterium]